MRIMKWLSLFTVGGIIFFCLPSNGPTQQGVSGYTVISALELKKLQDSEKEILLIDTLAFSRYRQEHIPRQRISNSRTKIWIDGINRKPEEKARKISSGCLVQIRTGPSFSIVWMPRESAATAGPVGLSNLDIKECTAAWKDWLPGKMRDIP